MALERFSGSSDRLGKRHIFLAEQPNHPGRGIAAENWELLESARCHPIDRLFQQLIRMGRENFGRAERLDRLLQQIRRFSLRFGPRQQPIHILQRDDA